MRNTLLTEESPATNSRIAKAGVSCFYDSEVLNPSFVHRMKFSAKNPRLRQAPNRYSGPDVKMVTISAGSSQTVYLSSGSYRVAASACGSNYGGSEDLHGKYGSSFYISHSRY